MKPLLKTIVMLLAAFSLQNCQDLVLQSVESGIDAQVKASRKMVKPLKDKHAFTISAIAHENYFPYNHFMISLDGTDGSITINWGDNTSTNYILNGSLFYVEKIYESPGRYHISITGDLKNITGFHSWYGEGLLDDFNLKALTSLTSLSINAVPGPAIIDLSHNKKLKTLTLSDMNQLKEIRLPKQHSLSGVSLAASTNLTSSTVDDLINSVYKTAVKEQISSGFLHITMSPYEDGSTEMVGPPSSNSIVQLTELQNKYGWQIYPYMPSAVNY